MGTTFNTMIFRHSTRATFITTNNDLSRTDRDINNLDGLNSRLWWDTIWWHDQVTGTGNTVRSSINTGGTFFITN